MALEMNNATYARSKAGITKLKQDLDSDINKILYVLNPNSISFSELRNTIRNNWVGADANAFLKEVEKKVNDLYNKVKVYKTSIETAFANEYSDFIKFQNNNDIKTGTAYGTINRYGGK